MFLSTCFCCCILIIVTIYGGGERLMRPMDKGFYMYLNGSTLSDIAKSQGVTLSAVKAWMTRNDWVNRKKECIDDNGEIDKEVVRMYIKGKGNLNPVGSSKPIQNIVANPNDDLKAFVSETLKNSLRYFGNKRATTDFECETRIIEYFTACQDGCIIPTVEGLQLCLGIHKDTYYKWLHGNQGTVRADLLKTARLCIQEFDTQLAIVGKMPQILYIFISKNHYEMSDQTEQVITVANPFGDGVDKEDIRNRLLSTPQDDYIELDDDDLSL